jgi:lysozyme
MPLSGIDVSHNNGPIDWSQIANAQTNLTFAFAKATEGTGFTDPQFSANWSGIAAAGLLRGAYHFFHPELDPTLQAQNFLAALTAANNGSPILVTNDLPAILDVERVTTASPSTLCAALQTFLTLVEAATGRTPILYTNHYYWQTYTAACTDFAAYPLWVAEYGVPAPRALPAGWADYTFWQYTQTLPALPGTTTPLDANYFNGTLPDLQALAP